MAEKASTTRKKAPRQQMLDTLAETEKSVAERRESQSKPEEKVEARTAAAAIAAADELAGRGVVQSIAELKSSIGRMLSDLSDKLEEQVARYVQIQRAIAARDKELKEIYEIERSASTLTALLEAHDRKQGELHREHSEQKQQLEEEIEQTRSAWEQERKLRETVDKERDSAEQKRREREKEEYRYAQAREQQQARDQFADEMAKAQKELAERQAQAERDLAERERQMKSREEEFISLRQRVEAVPKELEAAVRAIEGSTSAKQLANLQQLLADQARKASER